MSAKRRNTRLMTVLAGGAVLAMVAVALLHRPTPLPTGPADAFELLPTRCDAVFVAPDPGRLGEHLGTLGKLKLVEALATLGNYQSAESLFADLARQTGWDLRSRDSMRAAGIDPDRPLVGLTTERGAALLAIPEADARKLEDLLARHAANRLGARARREERVGTRALVVFHVEGQATPSLVLAHAHRYTLLGLGTRGFDSVKAALEQDPKTSLGRDAAVSAQRQRLSGHDVFALACPTPASPDAPPPGSSLAATLDQAGPRLSGELPLSEVQALRFASLAAPAGADLVDRLDPRAFLVARLGGAPQLLEPLLDHLPGPVTRALAAAELDVKTQVLGNLEPGVAFSLSLAPELKLAGGMPALDARRTNPFEFLLLDALARTRDPAAAAATLEAIAQAAPRFGAKVEAQDQEGGKVYVTRYHLGEGASFALRDRTVVVAGGTGQLAALLGRVAGPAVRTPFADPEAARALREDGLALYLDLGRATSGVRAIPDSAYGLGGFAIRSAVLRWLDALDQLASLRASARLQGRILQAELALSLRAPAAGTQASP